MQIGMTYEQSIMVSNSMLASSLGSGLVDVLATSIMVLKMEETSSLCVAEKLDAGAVTVGTDVMVSHISSTPPNRKVTFKSELIEINGKVLKFKVTAIDVKGVVGEGTHTRVIVDKVRFEQSAKASK